jgi:glycosyltransferase involved in cell wall biosynthesis
VKEICFIVNVDWFFLSHRLPLVRRLESTYDISVIAGGTGVETNYEINTFQVKARIPTLKGIYQIYTKVKELDDDAVIIVVSPVMIILSHFILRSRRKVIYNFSGLGFLRSKPSLVRAIILSCIRVFPISGSRYLVVQNSDDYRYLKRFFKSEKGFYLSLISGSGYEENANKIEVPNFTEVTLGYVGRIRKDKGVLDLLRAVSDLQCAGYKVNLCVWGELDDKSRHGFNASELEELNSYAEFLKGFSNNKYDIYRSFNWFCLPSNGEGLSKAAIEASSFGLPLVLSNVEGNRDMINGNGFLFEYGDVENLKEVLIDILNLPSIEVKELSRKSRQMFEAEWTMDAVYNKWNENLSWYDSISS